MPAFSRDQREYFMRQALAEGQKALPACLPNPPVGCVIVRDNEVVARGHTQPPFEHHAEPMALAQLEGSLRDTVMFVTLEPCSFHQRTPSCAQEIIRREVGEVYAATLDPHPRNRGRGLEMLREGGVGAHLGPLGDEALADLGPYLWREQGE